MDLILQGMHYGLAGGAMIGIASWVAVIVIFVPMLIPAAVAGLWMWWESSKPATKPTKIEKPGTK